MSAGRSVGPDTTDRSFVTRPSSPSPGGDLPTPGWRSGADRVTLDPFGPESNGIFGPTDNAEP